MIKITTTHRPEREIEVEASEFRDLEAQGLIHSILGGDLASVGKSKDDVTKVAKSTPKKAAEKPSKSSKKSAPAEVVEELPGKVEESPVGTKPEKIDPEGGAD